MCAQPFSPVRYNPILVVPILAKARGYAHLVPKKVVANREGTSYITTVWVDPTGKNRSVQHGLFDLPQEQKDEWAGLIRKETGRKGASTVKRLAKERREREGVQEELLPDETSAVPIASLSKEDYYLQQITKGTPLANLSDAGLRRILNGSHIILPETAGRIEMERAIRKLAESQAMQARARPVADAHDAAIRRAIINGDEMLDEARKDYEARKPKEEWEYSVEDWVAIRTFDDTVDNLSAEYMRENWEQYGPVSIQETDVPMLHATTKEPILRDGKPIMIRRKTEVRSPIPDKVEGLRSAYRAYADDIASIYRESGGKPDGNRTLVHYRRVRNALRDGMRVPAEAVAYYPDLQEKYSEQISNPTGFKLKKIVFDTTECSRCGGTGKFSYNQLHGDMCYGCSGSGKMLTKQAKKASKRIEEIRKQIRSIPVSEIKVGDKIWQSLTAFSKRDWLTVTKVSLGPSWGYLKDGVLVLRDTIQLDLQDKKGNKSGYGAPSETIIERYSPWPQWAADEMKKMEGVSVTFVEEK